MRNYRRMVLACAIATLVVMGLAACGSSSSSSTGSSGGGGTTSSTPSLPLKPGENPVGQQLNGKKKGGILTVYSTSDFQHLDPGEAYYTLDYQLIYATQTPLYAYMPNQEQTVSPLLATGSPVVTDGGKTITVHIRSGVHYSPPVNREVTAADVKFAIERGANPNVANGYFPAYFSSLVGASTAKGGPISGIVAPDKTTIVFHLTKPRTALFIGALSLPLTAPVPPEFVKPLDAKSPTTFGTTSLVFTGPYMVKSDPKTGKFAGIGYSAGKSTTLVRNPNWSGSGDPRPAYLDGINVSVGGDASVIGQQVLKGSHAVQLDTPAQAIVKLAYQQYPSQITFTTGSGDHYVGLDTAKGPFTNVNLRRAVWAALDRQAIVKARGGPLVAQPMTHFIYPGVSGFNQAGGYAGPVVDYNKNVNGDPAVAAKYMKLAGYSSGKYTGAATLQVVGGNGGNDPAIVAIITNALTSLGFKTHVSLVDQAVMYGKYCQVPHQEIDACPTVGWVRDFADPYTVLFPTFFGNFGGIHNIPPTANVNYGQFDNPAVNQAMLNASLVVDPTAEAQAWANIDKMLVDQAAAVPEEYDNQPNIESKDVAGVSQLWNTGSWDFSFTSLK
jgi:peptide/nickel transport system substrate-binding protein